MIGIIRKDAVPYIANVLIFTVIQFVLPFVSDVENLAYPAMMYSFWCVLVAILPVMSAEHRERVDSGYIFLKALPVTDSETVAAKFLLPMSAVVIYAAVTWFNLGRLPFDSYGLEMARVWLVFNAAAGLALAGIIYSFTFRYGLSKLLPLIGAIFAGVIGGFLVASEMMARGKLGHILPALERVAGIGWPVAALAGIAVWSMLMATSIRIKRSCHV